MAKLLIAAACFLLIVISCKKSEDKEQSYTYKYKLKGLYTRDSSVTSNGYKSLLLKDDGSYCWIRRISGKDSLFCYGTYVQTSDTSMLWNGTDVIDMDITPIDTILSGIKLQINGSPVVPPLYGFTY